jgi:roadblock/LC7 domain-containing protein
VLPLLALPVADARPPKPNKAVTNGRILLSTREDLVSVEPDGEGRRRVRPLSGVGASFSPDGRLMAFAGRNGDIFISRADGSRPHRITRARFPLGDRYPVFTPNGKRVVFERLDVSLAVEGEVHPDLYSIKTTGKRLKQLTATPQGERSAAISPDGRWIAYTRYDWRDPANPQREQIWLMRASGAEQRPLSLPGPPIPYQPGTSESGDGAEFSPSGRQVVFQCDIGGICIINRDGSDQRVLIGEPEDPTRAPYPPPGPRVGEGWPAFSPDGKRIAYAATISGERSPSAFELRVANADGTNVRTVLSNGYMEVEDWQRKPVAPPVSRRAKRR